ncbi:MAG TPA: peptidylprolyl isomerase [Vicinamibacteria bacterium]|nr:peptidylprolyl isomerase [Vicinamibacteria bacterium]
MDVPFRVASVIEAVLALFVQWPLDLKLLAIEDARADETPLVEALGKHPVQAIRALGRFERAELSRHVVPFLGSSEPDLRIEAANALAQMKTTDSLGPYLERERDPRVRSALYEAIGRLEEAREEVFLPGLEEDEPIRFGAAKGLESALRRHDRKPSPVTVASLARVVRDADSEMRRLALTSLLRAESIPQDVLELAFADPDPQVRRLAVMGLGEAREDSSYLVRYEGLRVAFDCALAERSLSDESEHVVLLAIDRLAEGCNPAPLEPLVRESSDWRKASHALVSLAKLRPDLARGELPRFVTHPVWQARVYAARAAKHLEAEDTLESLRADPHPNVVAEALVTPEDAVAALGSDDYGLLVTALGVLEGWKSDGATTTVLLETLERLSSQRRHTSRDPRRLLLERLRGSPAPRDELRYLISDFDPAIASLAADLLGERPQTTRFAPSPLPEEEYLLGLRAARARIEMKEAGTFVVELLPEAAPLTVAQFARLAESGYYDGLTFHRIVPNFVLQGGSPGANEYVGRPEYIRDEVSTLSHERGTLGISTRGRDTGDSQIFINLVDNFRLDHNYTVFARVVEGMENVDRILEGDVMERVVLLRRSDLRL